MKSIIAVFLLCSLQPVESVGQVGDVYPSWKEGYLDIHHISTGKGDAAFFILPDGTTMLFDAGEMGRAPGPRQLEARPDGSRSAGEWISRYITHMLRDQPGQKVNYMLISHFHSDHMGAVAELGERIPFGKVIDRAWPDYDWPVPLESATVQTYREFLNRQIEQNDLQVEPFQVGRNDQMVLVREPAAYPNFEIRNIAANGSVWTGVDSNVRNHFPPLEGLPRAHYPTENMCSLAIRLSYGNFDYFTGGDLVGEPSGRPGMPAWHQIETPVAMAVGPVEVNVTNHHAHFDAQNEFFVRSLRPRIHIIQAWVINHPAPSTLRRLLSTDLYPGPRGIFSTDLMEGTRNFIGAEADNIKPETGHIVVRVKPGGDTYKVYVLDHTRESFKVEAVYGPYRSD